MPLTAADLAKALRRNTLLGTSAAERDFGEGASRADMNEAAVLHANTMGLTFGGAYATATATLFAKLLSSR